MMTDNESLSVRVGCPITTECNGMVGFRKRAVECKVTNTFIVVVDLVCNTCNYKKLNVFDLKCEPSVNDLVVCIEKDAEVMGEISISQVIKKYYVSDNLAMAAFRRLGAWIDDDTLDS